MSTEYGRLGTEVVQSFRNNNGIFTPKDIYELDAENKWTNFGQLELIETQTVSSAVASVDFTAIQETIYNVHFATVNNLLFSNGSGNEILSYQLYESGVLKTSSYHYAQQFGSSGGSFGEQRSTGTAYPFLSISAGSSGRDVTNCYVYFYNLGDSSKYSFATNHATHAKSDLRFAFSSSVLDITSQVDGIRFRSSNSENITQGSISLYGIRFAS